MFSFLFCLFLVLQIVTLASQTEEINDFNDTKTNKTTSVALVMPNTTECDVCDAWPMPLKQQLNEQQKVSSSLCTSVWRVQTNVGDEYRFFGYFASFMDFILELIREYLDACILVPKLAIPLYVINYVTFRLTWEKEEVKKVENTKNCQIATGATKPTECLIVKSNRTQTDDCIFLDVNNIPYSAEFADSAPFDNKPLPLLKYHDETGKVALDLMFDEPKSLVFQQAIQKDETNLDHVLSNLIDLPPVLLLPVSNEEEPGGVILRNERKLTAKSKARYHNDKIAQDVVPSKQTIVNKVTHMKPTLLSRQQEAILAHFDKMRKIGRFKVKKSPKHRNATKSPVFRVESTNFAAIPGIIPIAFLNKVILHQQIEACDAHVTKIRGGGKVTRTGWNLSLKLSATKAFVAFKSELNTFKSKAITPCTKASQLSRIPRYIVNTKLATKCDSKTSLASWIINF